jgi:hypothetical protein
MRSSTDRPIESLKEYIRERNRVLRYQSPSDLKQFMKDRGMPVPRNKEVLDILWHKSITAATSLDREYRQKSKEWLTVRGHNSLDDGDL